MKIRLATLDDLETVYAICLRFHEESRFSRYPINPDKLRLTVTESIQAAKASCILLAETSGGGIAGMLAGFVTSPRFTDIRIAQDHGFYVLPEHRGSSAAMKLMIAFRRWAENRQAVELCINQNVDIDQARFNRFMHHLNFKCCGANFVLPLF
ncbi:GNAT family N-acetyltransferase [Zoogloea sp.]|uniref:GNAT family N-acetyltransferase n=1 Tax=Zoogloea sp. TaxID=49181 RepID=UPI0031FE349F